MTRTTLDINSPILKDLKRLQKKENKSLGRLASDLLAEALARHRSEEQPVALSWTTREMRPLVDLSDKEAVYAALDEP